MQRAALYIRVSTEEQALHGYSLDAQKDSLTAYAKKHDLAIVGYYVDDGYSARKKYTNRKEFMRMLADVEQDKIDIILFIKLDRWFRSVKDYYKIQEILEAHNVGWKTTEENYDTTTTNGRLHINIRLSVAQDESDRTSDRIKFVFDNKVARGEVISGAQPMGLKIENKRVVHDPEKADMVRDLFNFYATRQSAYATMLYILETYGVEIEKSTFRNMLTNTLYIGKYRDNNNYCEPLIDKDVFEKVQRIAKSRGFRKTSRGYVHIFTGLIQCSECGYAVTSNRCVPNGSNGYEYYYYRCDYASRYHACANKGVVNEKVIEQWLLDNIEDEITKYVASKNALQKEKPKPTVDKAKIKRKLDRLKELYINELIPLDEYRRDYESLQSQLQSEDSSSEPLPDTDKLNAFINSDFKALYHGLSREGRRALWRGIIKEMHMDAQKNLTIFFA